MEPAIFYAREKMFAVLVICGLISGILLSIEVGYRIGLRRWPWAEQNIRGMSSAMEAAVFGLLGLLIAFTFYGAAVRFDNRRSLTVQEANAIGTAYLRLNLLPPEAQPELREDFRTYIRSRLAVFKKIPDREAVLAELARSSILQTHLWEKAVEATKASGPAAQVLLL